MGQLSVEAPEFVPQDPASKARKAKLSLSPLKLADPTEAPPEVLQPVAEERVYAVFDQLPWTPGNGVITPSPNSGRMAHTFWKEKYGRSHVGNRSPSVHSYRGASKSSQGSPLSVMTRVSHTGSGSSPATPASYVYSSNSSPASTPSSGGRHMLVTGVFQVPPGCVPVSAQSWQQGYPAFAQHQYWAPQRLSHGTLLDRPPPLSPAFSHRPPVSPASGIPSMAPCQWQDSSGQYWVQQQPVMAPLDCTPCRMQPSQKHGAAQYVNRSAHVTDNLQNISPNLEPGTPIRSAAAPRRATPPQASPDELAQMATPGLMRPKFSRSVSGGSSGIGRKRAGAAGTDLHAVQALLQKAAEQHIESKAIQDLTSLAQSAEASNADMNARQRRTLRRAVERAEQEMRTTATSGGTSEPNATASAETVQPVASMDMQDVAADEAGPQEVVT